MTVFKYYTYTSFQVLHAFANDCNFYILQKHGNRDMNTVDNSNSLAILGNVAMQIKTDISQIRSQSNLYCRKKIKIYNKIYNKIYIAERHFISPFKRKDHFCYKLQPHAGIAAGPNIKKAT